MSKKVVVPEGMRYVFEHNLPIESGIRRESYFRALEAVLLWWSENPIMPEHYVYDELRDECSERDGMELTLDIMELWQRRMFLAPEPEVPEVVRDLLVKEEVELQSKWGPDKTGYTWEQACETNEAIKEAYRRGKESR